ncbi:MAG: hypothetical protein ABSE46_18510 [Terracidiphilus sp.]|jgi:hypothetical protein
MNKYVLKMGEEAGVDGLDGQWKEILRAGAVGSDQSGGETYTPGDLDGLVREYTLRDAFDEKAPVALGLADKTDSEPVGQVDALRRVGDSLQGKFSKIDPRVEHLYGRGAFPKLATQVKRSPDGDSLQRVGLISPVYNGSTWDDNATPSLENLMKKHVGNKEHVFSGGGRGHYIEVSQPVFPESAFAGSATNPALAQLKKQGYWCDFYDRKGLPLLFSEAVSNPQLSRHLVKFVKMLASPEVDQNSAILSMRAKYWARTHDVSFGEALDQVSRVAWDMPQQTMTQTLTPEFRQAEKEGSDRAVAGGVLSQQLADMAWARARSKNETFKQSLAQVCAERPDLVSAQYEKQLDQYAHPRA